MTTAANQEDEDFETKKTDKQTSEEEDGDDEKADYLRRGTRYE